MIWQQIQDLMSNIGFQRAYLRQRLLKTLIGPVFQLPPDFFAESNILAIRIYELLKPLFGLDSYPYCSEARTFPSSEGDLSYFVNDILYIVYKAGKLSLEMQSPLGPLVDLESGLLKSTETSATCIYQVQATTTNEIFNGYSMWCENPDFEKSAFIKLERNWKPAIRISVFPGIISHRQATYQDKTIYESDTSDEESNKDPSMNGLNTRTNAYTPGVINTPFAPPRERGTRRKRKGIVRPAPYGLMQVEWEDVEAAKRDKLTGIIERQISPACVAFGLQPFEPIEIRGPKRKKESLDAAIERIRAEKGLSYRTLKILKGAGAQVRGNIFGR